jgi:hypothetical protein
VSEKGTLIKEFEASHGTVSDLWHDHLAGKETSLNPLGLVEAMIGAMQHAATLQADAFPDDNEKQAVKAKVFNFTLTLRKAIHNTFRYGQGTRDMSGPDGFTTEQFIEKVAWRVKRYLAAQLDENVPELGEPSRTFQPTFTVDTDAVNELFGKYDKDSNGMIDLEEFTQMLIKMGVAPLTSKREKKPDV